MALGEEMHIVTEVGVFGDLNVADPTKKRVLTEEELEKQMKEAMEANRQNLIK